MHFGCLKTKSFRWELNPQHAGLETAALPLSYGSKVAVDGLEPSTFRLLVECSSRLPCGNSLSYTAMNHAGCFSFIGELAV